MDCCQTGCLAPGNPPNEKRTDGLFCLSGPWPERQATHFFEVFDRVLGQKIIFLPIGIIAWMITPGRFF